MALAVQRSANPGGERGGEAARGRAKGWIPMGSCSFPKQEHFRLWEHRSLALNTGAAGSRQADTLLFCPSIGKEGTNLEFGVQWLASSHWGTASLLTLALRPSIGAHTSLADSSAMEPQNAEQT